MWLSDYWLAGLFTLLERWDFPHIWLWLFAFTFPNGICGTGPNCPFCLTTTCERWTCATSPLTGNGWDGSSKASRQGAQVLPHQSNPHLITIIFRFPKEKRDILTLAAAQTENRSRVRPWQWSRQRRNHQPNQSFDLNKVDETWTILSPLV